MKLEEMNFGKKWSESQRPNLHQPMHGCDTVICEEYIVKTLRARN